MAKYRDESSIAGFVKTRTLQGAYGRRQLDDEAKGVIGKDEG
jgi:hypothetical protein